MYKTQNDLVKELFTYLDRTEEVDSGRVFHPVHFSCARSHLVEPLGELLKLLKESIK